MAATIPDIPPHRLSDETPLYLNESPPPPATPARLEVEHLRELDITGLSYSYPRSTHGIHDVSFRVPAGSFTVITGQIGAGKTTLLRALLGTLPIDAGTIEWNGDRVFDPKTFFTPPHCAYTRRYRASSANPCVTTSFSVFRIKQPLWKKRSTEGSWKRIYRPWKAASTPSSARAA